MNAMKINKLLEHFYIYDSCTNPAKAKFGQNVMVVISQHYI